MSAVTKYSYTQQVSDPLALQNYLIANGQSVSYINYDVSMNGLDIFTTASLTTAGYNTLTSLTQNWSNPIAIEYNIIPATVSASTVMGSVCMIAGNLSVGTNLTVQSITSANVLTLVAPVTAHTGTLTGAGLNITGPATLTNNVTIGGLINVTGSATLTNNVAIGGLLNVTGPATTLTNNLGIGGLLSVTGPTTLTNNLAIGGLLNVTGPATLTNNVAVGGLLNVTGPATLTNNVAIGGLVNVAGPVAVNNAMTVTGNLAISGNASSAGSVTAAFGSVSGPLFSGPHNSISIATGGASVTGVLMNTGAAATISGNLAIGGTTSARSMHIAGFASVTGNMSVGSNITVTLGSVTAPNIFISGLSTFSGNVTLGGNLTGNATTITGSSMYINGPFGSMSGNLSVGSALVTSTLNTGYLGVSGNASLTGSLTVATAASIGGTLTVAGAATITGTTTSRVLTLPSGTQPVAPAAPHNTIFVDSADQSLKMIASTGIVDVLTPLTTLGDLNVFGTVSTRFSLGTVDNLCLTTDLSQTLGLAWTVAFGSEYQFVSDNSSTSTGSTAYTTKLTLNTTSLQGGRYIVQYAYHVNATAASKYSQVQVAIDNTICHDELAFFSNASIVNAAGGFETINLAAGIHTVVLRFRAAATATTIAIKYARLHLYRAA